MALCGQHCWLSFTDSQTSNNTTQRKIRLHRTLICQPMSVLFCFQSPTCWNHLEPVSTEASCKEVQNLYFCCVLFFSVILKLDVDVNLSDRMSRSRSIAAEYSWLKWHFANRRGRCFRTICILDKQPHTLALLKRLEGWFHQVKFKPADPTAKSSWLVSWLFPRLQCYTASLKQRRCSLDNNSALGQRKSGKTTNKNTTFFESQSWSLQAAWICLI